jgi:hypothetical protein
VPGPLASKSVVEARAALFIKPQPVRVAMNADQTSGVNFLKKRNEAQKSSKDKFSGMFKLASDLGSNSH